MAYSLYRLLCGGKRTQQPCSRRDPKSWAFYNLGQRHCSLKCATSQISTNNCHSNKIRTALRGTSPVLFLSSDCRYGAHFHNNRGQSADTAMALLIAPGTECKLKTNYDIVQGLPTPVNQQTLTSCVQPRKLIRRLHQHVQGWSTKTIKKTQPKTTCFIRKQYPMFWFII